MTALAPVLVAAAALASAGLPTETERAALIEANRKSDVVIEVSDAGQAIAGARVEIRQVRHAFLFGSNIFGLRPEDASDAQRAYQRRFEELFNFATLPFYWGTYERERGSPDEARLEAMAAWCRARHIAVKGHPVLWHEVFPSWIAPDTEMLPLVRRRVRETVGRFQESVEMWDVVNEPVIAGDFDNAWGRYVKAVGPVEAVDGALRLAAEVNPDGSFVVNDFEVGPDFAEQIRQLQGREAPFHAIGLQSHMHGGEWTLEKAWEICETYAQFGLPIHFTELTVLSGPKEEPMTDYHRIREGWHTTPEHEALQADYVAQLYELLFAHPAVAAITWWDLSDHRSWMRAPAGLLREDMSPKPAYERLLAKIKGEWWTAAAAGSTNAEGRLELRGFLGEYEGTVSFPDGEQRSFSFQIGSEFDAPVVVAR